MPHRTTFGKWENSNVALWDMSETTHRRVIAADDSRPALNVSDVEPNVVPSSGVPTDHAHRTTHTTYHPSPRSDVLTDLTNDISVGLQGVALPQTLKNI